MTDSVGNDTRAPRAVALADAALPAGPYSPALLAGEFLYVSSQAPLDANGRRVGETFLEQAYFVMEVIGRLAEQVGSSLANTVRLRAFLSDLSHFDEWNEVCAATLARPYPARTTMPVPMRGFDLEVDATIWVPSARVGEDDRHPS